MGPTPDSATMTIAEALHHLVIRARRRCDQPVAWNLDDVAAVRTIVRVLNEHREEQHESGT